MALPKHFTEAGLALVERCTVFGVPLTDLSREELLAVAAMGWKNYEQALERAAATMRTARELKR